VPHPTEGFCARKGAVRETRLELEFKRYETYEEEMREVYRPKGLLASIRHGGEEVREDTLAVFFSNLIFC
jgi:hypothetical protein